MKTTVEISDDLAREAKELAGHEGVPFREVVEQGIRLWVAQHESKERFELRNRSVSGRGLQPEFHGKSWDAIREAAYEYKVSQ